LRLEQRIEIFLPSWLESRRSVPLGASMTDPDGTRLQVSPIVGALLGTVTGYVLGKPLLGILI
jgi:hypothetical protein